MGSVLQLRAMRLSTVGVLTLMVAACGSSGGSDNAAPTSTRAQSSSEMSSLQASSSMAASSSSAPVEAVAVASFNWDFESASPGIPNINGTMLADSDGNLSIVEGAGLGYSGNIALQAKTTNKKGSFITIDDFSGSHWGRVYYKATSSPDTVGTWSHTTLVAAYDSATQTQYRLVDMVAAPDTDDNAGKYQHLYNIDNPSEIDLSLAGDYLHAYGNDWVCLEWQVDAVNQQYHVYFNGDELTLKNVGTVANETDLQDAKKYNGETHDFVPVPAAFDLLKIGIQNYQGHNYTLLLDDIAIADARVGCDIAVESSSSSEAASSMAVLVGKMEYEAMCEGCHDGSGSGPNLSGTSLSGAALVTKIDSTMPKGGATDCQGQCATDVANYIETVIKN